MDRVITQLSSNRTLIFLLIVAILVGIGFGIAQPYLGGTMLDMLSDPGATEARLALMSESQRTAHIWVTLTLDAIYPIAYGGGLAIFAAHFSDRNKLGVAMPGLMLILVDLFENMLIVLMLNGNEQVIGAKALVTQVKWWLFGFSALLCLALAGAAALRHYLPGSVQPGFGSRSPEEI